MASPFEVIDLMNLNTELLTALKSAREQLEDYERERTGESFNDTRINAAIARAEAR